ncbi:major intrinsically disordered Notch2-binding receptor 1-like [Lampris incognitus]|uniref:major intrinsically disordered Notch2-binding receptor 1-like n=1 Tax=Lampris incognitus TaxID=2546036 RepID=UPI0024B4BF64|nr:major intrinsically disordered Notch2-binding receptor 1-like [Lampris incognitus]
MAFQQEYPLVLLGILEELANMRHWLSFQDLCRMVSTRFDLEHLIELRSLLFAAASRDPCFPATLFRDRVTTRSLGLSPIGVAADIVTIFNLIQMTGGPLDDSQPMRTQTVLPVDQSPGPSLPGVNQLSLGGRERAHTYSDSGSRLIDQHLLLPKSNYSSRKRASLPPDPTTLVSSPPVRARAVSFDLSHNSSLVKSDQFPKQAMQNIYLPLETDSESSGDSVPVEVFEAEQESSVGQKRSIFKKDFHNQPPLIPQVTVSSESPSPGKGQKAFDSRSFELFANPYPSPTATHQSPEKQTKHESLDDLQDSTYFGPGSIPDWSPRHLQPPRVQKNIWNNKSHSLEDRIGLGSVGMGMESPGVHLPRRSTPAISNLGGSSGGESGDSGLPGGGDVVKAQGTQTDPPDPRRLRSLVHADRLSFMASLDDPEFGEDDISAIFRFLDDMSICGSTGVLHPGDGTGAVNQDNPEARRGRLGQLQRLFHSLESSDDGLKSSVCKLLLRMTQIERQLESLSEVKAEISQVLSALQRLDEKIQQPIVGGDDGRGTGGRWLEPLSAGVSSFSSHPVTPVSESSDPQPLSVSGHLFQGTSTSMDWSRWNISGGQKDISKGQADPKGVKEGKKDVFTRLAPKSQPEEKSGLDSKQPNVSVAARDWTVSFSKDKDGKVLHGKMGQMDHANSTANLLSQKSSSLVEQVFNSALFRQKDSSLTGGLTSGKIMDPRLAESRGKPVWTVDDRESRISPLDLQGQESLNPNNMEFWMEDIYTPGYDALLRRKEADLRRAKACKLGALIATAVTIILIIVIPICTMRT